MYSALHAGSRIIVIPPLAIITRNIFFYNFINSLYYIRILVTLVL